MNFFELVKARHSIRSFQEKSLDAALIEQIITAVNQAPSAGNLQAYEIYVIQDLQRRAALAAAAMDQDFLIQAPVVLVFCAHPARSESRYGERGIKLYSIQDATIACAYAMLAATALGLSSVWVGAYDGQEGWKVLGEPRGLTPVAMLPVGYAKGMPRITSRRQLSDIAHYG